MRIDRGFLLSFYLSLALAGACLGYVTLTTHPSEVLLLAGPVGVALLAAYGLEGRWSLTTFWATIVGLVLAACAGIWFAGFFIQLSSFETDTISWPVLLLPHMGFWLVLLTLAKLFRPKSAGDFWALHLMGFAGVALAGSLDSDFLLSFLLFAYLACMLWSLACFYLYRENLLASRKRPSVPGTDSPAVLPWRWLGLLQAGRRALVILGVVVVFYLLTPRHTVSSWEESLFRASSLQAGLGDSLIDLNRTGTIRTSTAVAFAVQASTADGQPKVDLDSAQRWRGVVLNRYDAGPIIVAPDQPVPVVFFKHDGKTLAGLRHADGELRAPRDLLYREVYCNSYRQVTKPVPDPTLGGIAHPNVDYVRTYAQLPPLPGLSPWLRQVLQELVADGKLTAEEITRDATGRLPARHHERLARALEAYLALSGKYTYSLTLPRQDRNADPVVDFLCNVKQGHCERFASALTVLLRSQGIPARMIAGFRGAEHQGEGVYHIRQDRAHAWVEALIERPGPDGQPERRWLTLDPTPSEDAGTESLSALGRWWRSFRHRGAILWRDYVVEYTAEQQDQVLFDLFNRLSLRPLLGNVFGWASPLGLLALALPGVALLYMLAVFRRRRRRKDRAGEQSAPHVAFYAAWLAILARRCELEPRPAQTAQEFARQVANRLRRIPAAAGLVEFPACIARLYYRVRYAGQPLTDLESRNLEAQLREADRTLAGVGSMLLLPDAEPVRASPNFD
jgi:transglutaminase-like putative cysteine protease